MAGKSSEFLYQSLARDLATAIRQGVYGIDERMPSLRRVSEHFKVSLATAVQALQVLEEQGLVEARPKSGYFVRAGAASSHESPAPSSPPLMPTRVNVGQLAMSLVNESRSPGLIKLGAAVPGPDLLPVRNLSRLLAGVARNHWRQACGYEDPQGALPLRRQIARLMRQAGCKATPEDIIVTNGCLEALTLALRCVANAGDTVAIESPTYFGILQVIESLGMKALEVATDASEGINVGELKKLIAVHNIRACVLMPNHSNPLGASMPDKHKKAVVDLLQKNGIPLIEDDVYGAMSYRQPRPKAAKAFETADNVILCSSFSKTIAPGYRIGWIYSRLHREPIAYQKFLDNISTATLPQLALAEFLARGGYARTLRTNVQIFQQRMEQLRYYINEYFPDGCRFSLPGGGFVLWLELPPQVNCMELYNLAMEKRIAISPGILFCAHGQYRNHIRLSCGAVEGQGLAKAMRIIGGFVKQLI